MAHATLPQHPSDSLGLSWSWCGRCQRAYITGTCRLIRFNPDALHTHPALLKLCPYDGCYGNTARHAWQWSTLRVQHPEYPVIPERNVVYVR
jgi:hypothetical protein